MDNFKSISDFENSLQRFLNSGCSIWIDGRISITKQLVDRIKNLKIEIYSKEHGEPHFHVKANEVNAVFKIKDCSLINGNMSSGEIKLVEWWYNRCRYKLIELWNRTRPTNCQVGYFKE